MNFAKLAIETGCTLLGNSPAATVRIILRKVNKEKKLHFYLDPYLLTRNVS